MFFKKEAIQETIAKNLSPSYGLTIVYGRPVPEGLTQNIRALRAELEGRVPERIIFYEDYHLHATIYAPKRGRYIPVPKGVEFKGEFSPAIPLTAAELASERFNLQSFYKRLLEKVASLDSFKIAFDRISIAQNGSISIVGVAEPPGPLRSLKELSKIQGCDPVKHEELESAEIHSTVGYFGFHEPFAPMEEPAFVSQFDRARMGDKEFLQQKRELGKVEVGEVSLVHYRDRMLKNILGMVTLKLGVKSGISKEEFYRCLKIS
jgi:hypothetical protein